MMKRGLAATVISLCLSLTLCGLLSGCGSAGEATYLEELQEIFERLSARLEIIAERVAGEHPTEGGESLSSAAVAWSEMVELLEEGARELSHVKVPAGREELHASLLELLESISLNCRKAAGVLLPSTEEHGGEGFSSHPAQQGDEKAVEGGEEHEESASTEQENVPGPEPHETLETGSGG